MLDLRFEGCIENSSLSGGLGEGGWVGLMKRQMSCYVFGG